MESELSVQQERALEALFSSKTLRAAADDADVSERTLSRWLQAGPFREEYRRIRREMMTQTTAKLQALAPSAVDALGQQLDTEPGSAGRTTAITAALNFAYKSYEVEDLSERLTDLEQAIEADG